MFWPFGNISPILFYTPLVIIGSDPILVLFAKATVLQYQTFLHTETIGKLPKSIEFIMNTPSYHRVHHGNNKKYLDKNYAGTFITWGRLFGTFQQKGEKVMYGVLPQIKSVNPFIVFFHGYHRLIKNMVKTPKLMNKLKFIYQPPEWKQSE